MAQSSSRRLFNAAQLQKSDTDYANVYERIFQTLKSDQSTYELVQGTVGGIANQWKETDSRVDSNVRIYCDEDRRWTEVGYHHYIDVDNLMVSEGPGECYKSQVYGYMSRHKTQNPDTNSPKHINAKIDNRAVITLCEEVFDTWFNPDTDVDAPKKLSDIPTTANMGGMEVEKFGDMVSATILHEFTHFPTYGTEDVGPGNGYGWNNIMASSFEESRRNADSYAFFMLWAGLADRGYTLPRRLNAQGSVDGINAMRARQGILALYRDITK
ncbi:hypothetical protein NHQ30_002181 [Ciborinia camelliae]|nr:hypothetical protein NHQ30_002181 [Ciborinia camelliae]